MAKITYIAVSLAVLLASCAAPIGGEGQPLDTTTPTSAPTTTAASEPAAGADDDGTLPAGILEIVSTRNDCLSDGTEGWIGDNDTLVEAEGADPKDPNLSDGARRVAELRALGEYLNKLEGIVTGTDPMTVPEGEYGTHDTGPLWGAGWLDSGIGKLVVTVTDLSAVDTEAMYAVVPDGAEDLEIREVPYSYADLMQLQLSLRKTATGNGYWGVNTIMNRLDITAPGPEGFDTAGLPDGTFCMYVYDATRPMELVPFHDASISGDGSELSLTYESGGCYEFDHVETEVLGDDLVVGVFSLAGAAYATCTSNLRFEPLTVPLDPPVDPGLAIVQDSNTPERLGG